MDEGKLRKDSIRAIEAKQIIESPLVVEALNLIRENLHKNWEVSKYEEERQREEAWKMLKVVNEFERFFLKVMEDGQIANKELTLMEHMKSKVKSYL